MNLPAPLQQAGRARTTMRSEDRYDSLFQFYGWKHSVDWLLLKAQVKAESGFDPDARSPAGARGLSQFMTRTWQEWRDAKPGIQPAVDPELVLKDPRDPEDTIAAPAAYMSWLFEQLGGSRVKVLAAYNWGIGNVRRVAGDPEFGARIPRETREYIARVERYYAQYQKEGRPAVRAV